MNRLLRNVTPRQTIMKNAFWLLAAQGLSRLFRFGVIFLAARALGADGYGSFSYALAASVIAFMLADWGAALLVVREFNKRPDRERFLQAALGFKVALSTAFLVLGGIGWFLIGDPGARGVYLLLLVLMFLQQARDFFLYVLRAEERMEREFVVTAVEALGTFALAGIFFLLGGGVLSLGLAYVAAMAGSLAVAAYQARGSYGPPFARWDRKESAWLFRNGWSLALFGVLVLVFFSTSQIVLGHARTPAEVGLYALASKVVTLGLVVPQIVMTTLFPYLIRVAGSQRGRTVALATTGTLTALGILAAVATYVLAPLMVSLVGGQEFAQAVPVLRHLIWILAMLFPVTFLDYYLIAHGKQTADMVVTAVAAGANVLLNVWLIPPYGISGAVWATMLGQALNLALTFAIAARVFVGKATVPPTTYPRRDDAS